MQIKHSSWFAAGPEVSRALALLSDGAFRLFMFLCLNADRKSGSISISYTSASELLKTSKRSITTYFGELRGHGVCRIIPAANQHGYNQIVITDEFWPYTRRTAVDEPKELTKYVQRIKSFLAARKCVKCAFSGADQKLAASYFNRKISLEQIERAIALACCNKYVSLLNGSDSGPIVSFHYFADTMEEAGDGAIQTEYWNYVMSSLQKLESQWVAKNAL